MHIAIRADGGSSIGFGHLVRTGAFAERVLEAENRVTYATSTPRRVREMCPVGVEIIALDPKDEHQHFLKWISKTAPDRVLTDSYDIKTKHQRAISGYGPRLSVVLDDARFEIFADVVINGNVYAPSLEYKWIGSEPKWCLGTDYLLLRKDIRELAEYKSPFRETAEHALITMGGSDVFGTTPGVIRAFDGMDLSVDVIVGPGFENLEEIHRAVTETEGRFDVIENPDDLAERMFQADLAVSATGSTIYELLALGTPTIGLPQSDNQEPIAETLDNRDAIETLDKQSNDSLSKAVQSLSKDADRRFSLRERGKSLVDSKGVERVYDTVMSQM